jgi:hypothetical protein
MSMHIRYAWLIDVDPIISENDSLAFLGVFAIGRIVNMEHWMNVIQIFAKGSHRNGVRGRRCII